MTPPDDGEKDLADRAMRFLEEPFDGVEVVHDYISHLQSQIAELKHDLDLAQMNFETLDIAYGELANELSALQATSEEREREREREAWNAARESFEQDAERAAAIEAYCQYDTFEDYQAAKKKEAS